MPPRRQRMSSRANTSKFKQVLSLGRSCVRYAAITYYLVAQEGVVCGAAWDYCTAGTVLYCTVPNL
jgi:hypothetical protein